MTEPHPSDALRTARALYFIALLPPPDVRAELTQLKEYIRDTYGSKAALRSPPHITLLPPFKYPDGDRPILDRTLAEFAAQYPPVPLVLSGFAAFAPRVVYADVVRSPELMALQPALEAYLQAALNVSNSRGYPTFKPHVTLAFKDLKRSRFKPLFEEMQGRSLHYEFVTSRLTLLRHNGQRWNVAREFPFHGTTADSWQRREDR